MGPDGDEPLDGAPAAEQMALELDRALRQVRELERALATCRVIGTAIGILAERHRLGSTEAFAALVKASQDGNRKLRDLASDIVGAADAGRPVSQDGARPASSRQTAVGHARSTAR